jgi:predicted Zn finger-like uncharacterized protein
MILTCPECATSYFVDDSKIPPEGRSVRCASCGARWTAQLEPELELVSDPEEGAIAREPEVEAPPEPPISDLSGEELPKVFRAKADTDRKVRQAAAVGVAWAAAVAVVAVLVALAIVFRADVVRSWPRSAAAYAVLGLPVNSLGLVLENVKAEPALKSGHAALSISGRIRNVEDQVLTAPPLRINLLNKAGKPVVTQIARATDPRIPPGQTRHFAIDILDPPTSAHDLEVSFIADQSDAKAAHAEPKAAAHHAPEAHPAAGQDAGAEGLRSGESPVVAPAPVEATPLGADSPYGLEHH